MGEHEATGAGASTSEVLADAVPFAMALLRADGVIEHVNQAWAGFEGEGGPRPSCGVGQDYLEVCELAAAAGDDDAAATAAGVRELLAGARTAFVHDYPYAGGGHLQWFQLEAAALERQPGFVVVHTDVTHRVMAEKAYHQQARQDPLTGLPNRALVYEVLDAELVSAGGQPLSVLMLDLDAFKNVNDSLGHDVGDLLLRDIADRLGRTVQPPELLGRVGGDEFVLIVPRCDADRAQRVAQRVSTALHAPFEVAGMHLPVTAGVGIATTSSCTRAVDLLRDADAAMHAAKASGRDRRHAFTPDLHRGVAERLELVSGLRRGLRLGELVLHYQPVLDVRTGAVGGAEALMRWDHPQRGLLPPGLFIPVAEETGLIVPMSRWLLVQAAYQGAEWASQGFHGRTGVNISAEHLAAGTLVDDVSEALDLAGLAPQGLIVEITETALAQDTSGAVQQLSALRELGVQVAIDDFGAGYSSLGQLVDLPADVLKLDRTLLPAGDGSARSRTLAAIMRAVIGVAEAMDLLVLAEGVETEAELAVVRELGCPLAQGYLLGRPVPPQQLVAALG